ncbi:hypothetical protein B4Q13_19365, partial [Lacticaseibacillus rhamnosus]
MIGGNYAVGLVLAVIYIALTLAADILNAVLDPRLRSAWVIPSPSRHRRARGSGTSALQSGSR